MTNNLNKILPLLRFDLGSYHVQVLQRSKDGHDGATRTVAEWFVSSSDKLTFLMPGIILLCQEYNARCYINVNPKSDRDVSWKIAKGMLERLETNAVNPISILSHAHDSVQGNEVKYWVVDIDDYENKYNLDNFINSVNKCQSGFDENVVARLHSKSGVHLITHPFNLTQITLPEGVEIKKNASTILYCT